MADEILPFEIATNKSSIIKVLGVGGGGSNAVNHMFKQGIEGVDFMICNTDAQALAKSNVPLRLQLGITLTEGLGAGNRPERGREAAIESMEEIKQKLGDNTKMMFITAGMGGGTGTGAAPVIAQIAKEMDILTIGIVTIPFRFEGKKRINQAIEGITEMGKYVDSLLIVNNEKIREIYGNLGQKEAFGKADDVLTIGAKSIAEIITKEGHVNVDFADVKTVMANSGVALMGAGEAEGEDRALKAIEGALNSPLLNNNDISGAVNILLNITSGTSEVTMDELGFINDYVQERTGFSADLIWGSSEDKELGEKVAITIIATGFNASDIPEVYTSPAHNPAVTSKIKRTNLPTDFHKEVPIEIEDKTKEVGKKNEPNYNIPNIEGEIKLVSADSDRKKEEPVFKTSNQFKQEFGDIQLNEDGLAEIKASLAQNPTKIKNRADYTQNIDKNEEEPAYKRYGVSLDLDRKIESDKISRFMLTGSGSDTKLNENNRYLHDNVD